jgi:hypothetical protein
MLSMGGLKMNDTVLNDVQSEQKNHKKIVLVGLVVVALIIALCVAFVNLNQAHAADQDFSFTGNVQEYTADVTGWYKLEVWGAQGGQGKVDLSDAVGGKGGYSVGAKYLTAGEKLYVYVGGTPSDALNPGSSFSARGWNGGGQGVTGGSSGGGGGGGTDIRTTGVTGSTTFDTNFFDRIITAGGGGGGQIYGPSNSTASDLDNGNATRWAGGYGGGSSGNQGARSSTGTTTNCAVGGGGTQTAGGTGTTTNSDATYHGHVGVFGKGGDSNSVGSINGDNRGGRNNYGSGGGGGWFGGGAGGPGSATVCSGGGGSGNIDGVLSFSANTTGGPTVVPTMIAGNDGTYGNGSTGAAASLSGKAKISFLGTTNALNPTIGDAAFPENPLFGATRSVQEWTTTKRGIYRIEAWGAAGGASSQNQTISSSIGGFGAYSAGDIVLPKGQKLYVYVGSVGLYNVAQASSGGWNGGGQHGASNSSGGGGGASDVRLVRTLTPTSWNESTSLHSRIIVAAGGGGSDDAPANNTAAGNDGTGGAGGGNVGIPGLKAGLQQAAVTNNCSGTVSLRGTGAGGTQCSGAAFGVGENSNHTSDSGGGGGGWFGGISTNASDGGAGGGSSFISGQPGSLGVLGGDVTPRTSISGAACAGAGVGLLLAGCSENYNGAKFYHTKMIDGGNCEWINGVRQGVLLPTAAKTSASYPTTAEFDLAKFDARVSNCTGNNIMPDPLNPGGFLSTRGNTGDGYVRITLIDELPNPDIEAGDITAKSLTEKSAKVDVSGLTGNYQSILDVLKNDDIPEEDIKLDVSSSNVEYTVYYSDQQACINTIKAGGSTDCATSPPSGHTAGSKSTHISGNTSVTTVNNLEADTDYYFTVRADVKRGFMQNVQVNYASVSAKTFPVGQQDSSCDECKVW